MFDLWINNLILLIPHNTLGVFSLLGIIAVALFVLGKGADLFVEEAVKLSTRLGFSKLIIGATIVSIGTTLPEVTVSVVSALNGLPGLALGNAVGSITCNTALILGIAALVKPLPFKKSDINIQNNILLFVVIILVACSFIYAFTTGTNPFINGSRLYQWIGFVFIVLLFAYIIFSIKNKSNKSSNEQINSSIVLIVIKMIIGILLVILSSKVLIPTIKEFAQRILIPDSVIAATLVAFGTSLPELITAITAAKKGYGDLAIGNVIGANILNVLLVIGASTSLTPTGLRIDKSFFIIQFPAMVFVILILFCGIKFSKNKINRVLGAILLASYVAVTTISYIFV